MRVFYRADRVVDNNGAVAYHPRMSTKVVTGRRSLFRGKAGGSRYQGVLTPVGSREFESARKRLARLVGREAEGVSDADVMEFLARGEANSRKALGLA